MDQFKNTPVIIDSILKDTQYAKEIFTKKTIIMHHTVSGPDAKNVINQWNTDDRGRIATAFVISRDGTIYRCFDEKYYAFGLGVSAANSVQLEKQAIQIELCAWGYLTKTADGKYWNAYNKEVPANEVYELAEKWKGYKYFHKYSDAQVSSLKQLVYYLAKKYNIKGSLSAADFEYSIGALRGAGGFYTHNSYRKDKTDIYPDARIIDAFKKGWSEFSS